MSPPDSAAVISALERAGRRLAEAAAILAEVASPVRPSALSALALLEEYDRERNRHKDALLTRDTIAALSALEGLPLKLNMLADLLSGSRLASQLDGGRDIGELRQYAEHVAKVVTIAHRHKEIRDLAERRWVG